MKKLLCKEVGGACDEVFTGNTLEEIGQKAKVHAMAANDDAHKQKMVEMMAKSSEEQQAFWREMRQKFADTPDAE